MEIDRNRLVEILVGLTLIVFLILLTFVVIGVSESNKTDITITNSYNKDSFNSGENPSLSRISKNVVTEKPHYIDYSYLDYNGKGDFRSDLRYYADYQSDWDDYSDDYNDYSKNNDKRYLTYQDWGRLERIKGILGNDVDKYKVFLRNNEYVGGYFKIVFYFEDFYGRTTSDSMVKYVGPGEEEIFVFTDMTPNRNRHSNWDYEVRSLDRVPIRVSSHSRN